MVGIVETIGEDVSTVQPRDRVVVNVEAFCGDCFFCQHKGQAEYVRVPYVDQGLTKIPDPVTDRQALFMEDILAIGYWAADIAEISEGDTVLIIGAGLTGICTLQCVLLKQPKQVIVSENGPQRKGCVQTHYPHVLTVGPDKVQPFVHMHSDHSGMPRVADRKAGSTMEGNFKKKHRFPWFLLGVAALAIFAAFLSGRVRCPPAGGGPGTGGLPPVAGGEGVLVLF